MNTFKVMLITILISLSSVCVAMNLSNQAVFHRCFSQITGEYPSSPLAKIKINEIKSGKDPIIACLEIFDLASFSSSTNMIDFQQLTSTFGRAAPEAIEVGIDVLRTMHTLHFSWFATNNYPEIQERHLSNTANIFDPSSPAAYFSKALFDQNSNFENIVKGKQTYRPVREYNESFIVNGESLSPWNLFPKDEYIFTDARFAGVGKLLGFEILPENEIVNYSYDNDNSPERVDLVTGSIVYNSHLGGGILGLQPYLLQTIQANKYKPRWDGTLNVPRKWSRAVFNDLLCRDLPMVRVADAVNFVDHTSNVSFRKSSSCTSCHLSMDPLSGAVRSVEYEKIGRFFNQGHSAFIVPIVVDSSDADLFPTETDNIWYRRPARGHLYYREADGKFVNSPFTNLDELGNKLAAENGIYNCLAKRYYEYFTGISADIGDIADPDHPQLSLEQANIRNIVLALGANLKNHQNPRALIQEILNRPEYKSSKFNVGSSQ